jgi:hypothetical protein
MNIRYAHSPFARAFAGAAIAAAIAGSVSPASAVTCNILGFPVQDAPCQGGNSKAIIAHRLVGNPVKFELSVDWQGGSQVAVAYGVDVNGTHLNKCLTSAADDDPASNRVSSVSCSLLYGTAGTAPAGRSYNHPFNMASTFVIVI